MKLLNLEFQLIAHDTFRIAGSKIIYTDPFKVEKADSADIILLSHEHDDHFSPGDLKKAGADKARLVAGPRCQDRLKALPQYRVEYLDPGQKITVDGVEIEAVPAYNVNKFRSPGQPFHPQGGGGVGFIFKMDGTTVYYAGDTDRIPEMTGFRCDIALLPVSGTYVMTAEEAVEAAADIHPKIAVPMHYGVVAGTAADAQKFKAAVKNCRVEIM